MSMRAYSGIRFKLVCATTLVSLLAACGGGGGTPAVGASTPALSGLAATGAGISGGTVTARCISGPAITGVTDAGGSFNLALGSSVAPCMIEVTGGSPPTTLYRFAQSAGRINITPVTDLVVARALGIDPSTVFATFDSSRSATMVSNLAAAKTYVNTQVGNIAGMPLALDPMTGIFSVGDAEDKVLDALGAAMSAANKSINDLRAGATTSTALDTLVPPFLASPTSISATANSSSQITVSWSAVAGATSYKVFRATSSGSIDVAGTATGTATSTTFVDSSLAASTAYFYKVVAVNAVVTGRDPSPEASATTSATSGGGAGFACDTTLFSPGAPIVSPTAGQISGFARTYTGSEGDFDDSFQFAATGSATLVFNADGTATYNGTAYVPTSYCLETLTGGGSQLVIYAGRSSHFDLGSGNTWNGISPAGKAVNNTAYSGGGGSGAGGTAAGTQMGGSRIGSALSLIGQVTTLGNTTSSYGTDDGTLALYNDPWGITTDGLNLYIADTGNFRIRKMVISTGIVSTLVGSTSGTADGLPGTALFSNPKGITTDGTYLYVTEPSGSPKIRKISIADGLVSSLPLTLTGLTASTLRASITTDNTDLFIIVGRAIYKVSKTGGALTLLAGNNAVSAGSADGTGSAALFYAPANITTDGDSIYVTDSGNNNIRKIRIATGETTTVAGLAGTAGATNGTGTSARFDNPNGITTDGVYLYVNDDNYNTIRKVNIATTAVTSVAGGRGGLAGDYVDGTGTAAGFKSVPSLTTDGLKLYLIDNGNQRLRRIQ